MNKEEIEVAIQALERYAKHLTRKGTSWKEGKLGPRILRKIIYEPAMAVYAHRYGLKTDRQLSDHIFTAHRHEDEYYDIREWIRAKTRKHRTNGIWARACPYKLIEGLQEALDDLNQG